MVQRKVLPIFMLAFVTLLSAACGTPTPPPTPTTTPTPGPSPTPTIPPVMELGLNSIHSPIIEEGLGDIADAAYIGASRDRWVIEWYEVEQPWRLDDPTWGQGKGSLKWEGTYYLTRINPAYKRDAHFNFDAVIQQGYPNTLVSLHGIPRIYDCLAEFVGTPLPPFTDDIYETKTECNLSQDPSKSRIEGLWNSALVGNNPNPDNPWAHFVFNAAQHLSQSGITAYQIWNEPDAQWRSSGNDPGNSSGNIEDAWNDDYVQLVHVTGQAARQAGATTLVLGAPSSDEKLYAQQGDPTYESGSGWINHAWTLLDDAKDANGRFIKDQLNAIGIHSYAWPWLTWSFAKRARALIPDKPIWVTESGLNLCSGPQDGQSCGDDRQQAAYAIQQYIIARLADIKVNYHYRAYDFTLPTMDTTVNWGISAGKNDSLRPIAHALSMTTQYLGSALIDLGASIVDP